MCILFGIVLLHVFHILYELLAQMLGIIQIGCMNVQYIGVGADLYGHSIKILDFVRILDILPIDEMVGVSRIHHHYYAVLNAFLTDGEDYLVKVILIYPLFRLIHHQRSKAVNGLQLCRLISRRSFYSSEHDSCTGHPIHYIPRLFAEILGHAIRINLFKELGNNGDFS